MEHALIGLIELVLWLDRLALKPLGKAVPHLGWLSQDPAAVLAEGEVVIGPSRRYASALAMSLLLAFAAPLVSMPLLLALAPRQGMSPEAFAAFVVVAWLGTFLASALVMLRLFRGGDLVLKADGVESRYRKTVVYCPWALFDTPGQPFRPGRDRILLPVAADAVPFVEARRDETALARGSGVRTRQLRFKSANQAVLKALYEVDVEELGAFLLGLGRRLGRPVPGAPALPSESPAEVGVAGPPVMDEEGWITLSVTRLELPPFCCECGTHTTCTQQVRCYASLLRVGRFLDVQGDECQALRVPVCPPCRRANERLWRRVFGKRLAVGLLAPVLLGLAAALASREPAALALAVPLAVVGAPLAGWSGVRAAKRRTDLVRVRYFPREGVVALHFRQPQYAEAVLALLHDSQGRRPRPAG